MQSTSEVDQAERSGSNAGNDASKEPPLGPRLSCLEGDYAAPKLLEDWTIYQEMPAASRAAVLGILQGIYNLGLGRELAEQIAALAHRIGLEPSRVQSVTSTCRFLMGQAVRVGLSPVEFRKDLEQLNPGSNSGVEELAVHYESYGLMRRQEAIHTSLLTHGNILTGVDWRIDTIHASNHASKIDSPVIHLTLSYAHGTEERSRADSLSLLIPVADLQNLRATLDRIEGTLAKSDALTTTRSKA